MPVGDVKSEKGISCENSNILMDLFVGSITLETNMVNYIRNGGLKSKKGPKHPGSRLQGSRGSRVQWSNDTTKPQHHNTTAPQHHNTTPQHHSSTTPQHQTTPFNSFYSSYTQTSLHTQKQIQVCSDGGGWHCPRCLLLLPHTTTIHGRRGGEEGEHMYIYVYTYICV